MRAGAAPSAARRGAEPGRRSALGARISVAAEAVLRLLDVMERMASLDRVFTPVQGALADQHRRRYAAFEVLQAAEREVRSIFIRE